MSKRDRKAVAAGLSEVFGPADLLGNVIANDRKRGGRANVADAGPSDPLLNDEEQKPLSDEPISRTASHTASELATSQTSELANQQAGKLAEAGIPPAVNGGPLSGRREQRKRRPETDRLGMLAGRIAEARHMARTPTVSVGVRLPKQLNDWLDEYVHGAWPQRIRKQELVTEALQLLFAMRGRPGEEVLDTELLPKVVNAD